MYYRSEMITKINFANLAMPEKLRLLYVKGDFIVSIWYYKHKINLYHYNGYLVEVFYNPKIDKIQRVEPLESGHSRMKFYADQVKLPVDLLE
jgi:hypothetical protein